MNEENDLKKEEAKPKAHLLLEEIINLLKKLQGRLKDSFWGPYISLFLICNYQVLFIIFGDFETGKSIKELEKLLSFATFKQSNLWYLPFYYEFNVEKILNLYGLPFILTIFYTIIWPLGFFWVNGLIAYADKRKRGYLEYKMAESDRQAKSLKGEVASLKESISYNNADSRYFIRKLVNTYKEKEELTHNEKQLLIDVLTSNENLSWREPEGVELIKDIKVVLLKNNFESLEKKLKPIKESLDKIATPIRGYVKVTEPFRDALGTLPRL